MLPSEVVAARIANQAVPLTDTLGRVEPQMAATVLIIALAESGDTWGPVSPKVVGLTLKAVQMRREFAFFKNPFLCRPDYVALVTEGFARWLDPSDTLRSPIEFTELGLMAIGALPTPEAS